MTTTEMRLNLSLESAIDLQSVAIMLGKCPTCFCEEASAGCFEKSEWFFLIDPENQDRGVLVDVGSLRLRCEPRSYDCRDDFDFDFFRSTIDRGLCEIDLLHWQHAKDSSYGIVGNVFGVEVMIDGAHAAYACMERRKKFYFMRATREEVDSCSSFGSIEELFEIQYRGFDRERFFRNLLSLGVEVDPNAFQG